VNVKSHQLNKSREGNKISVASRAAPVALVGAGFSPGGSAAVASEKANMNQQKVSLVISAREAKSLLKYIRTKHGGNDAQCVVVEFPVTPRNMIHTCEATVVNQFGNPFIQVVKPDAEREALLAVLHASIKLDDRWARVPTPAFAVERARLCAALAAHDNLVDGKAVVA
jgi:hypothetical protein